MGELYTSKDMRKAFDEGFALGQDMTPDTMNNDSEFNEFMIRQFKIEQPSAPVSEEELLKYYHHAFRILKDWEIIIADDGKYHDQCCWNRKIKKATIYHKRNGCTVDQYLFHEIMHICYNALKGGTYKEKKEKEEIFIQDLCRIKDEFASQSQSKPVKPELGKSAEEILRKYTDYTSKESINEAVDEIDLWSDILDAMEEYASQYRNQPSVQDSPQVTDASADNFEIDLYKVLSTYNGLPKSEVVYKLEYVLKSVKLS